METISLTTIIYMLYIQYIILKKGNSKIWKRKNTNFQMHKKRTRRLNIFENTQVEKAMAGTKHHPYTRDGFRGASVKIDSSPKNIGISPNCSIRFEGWGANTLIGKLHSIFSIEEESNLLGSNVKDVSAVGVDTYWCWTVNTKNSDQRSWTSRQSEQRANNILCCVVIDGGEKEGTLI